MFFKIVLIFIFSLYALKSNALENCKWNNNKGIPCISINKTPNTSNYNSEGVAKKVFNKKQIIEFG